MNHQILYQQLIDHTRGIAILESTSAVLEWDERTYMPPDGGVYRAEQLTQLAGMIHRMRTDKQRGEWLEQLAGSALAEDRTSDSGATIFRLRRDYDLACKLPPQLVESITRATVIGQQRWEVARRENDFNQFLEPLRTIIGFKAEAAQLKSQSDVPYDALLDEYEEGATSEHLNSIFLDLRTFLVSLLDKIKNASRQPHQDILKRRYPIDSQRAVGLEVAKRIGFDFQQGRLDETTHPFCTSLGPSDTRILTRYDEHWFPGAFFGTIHEAGHGMYDQGLPKDGFGLPLGSYVSLGIHESQSRLWENMVGRSKGFWKFFYPILKRHFSDTLGNVDLDPFHFAINAVSPSLIRVEADEVTYNLHIIVRYELEQELISGELDAADLPDAWNAKYNDYLGIVPENASQGVLQDVHWSAGLFGYFPTYTLGNLVAAQLFEAATCELGDLETMFAVGEFSPLLNWLRSSIHAHGRRYEPNALIEHATGRPLSAKPLVAYLTNKYESLYGID